MLLVALSRVCNMLLNRKMSFSFSHSATYVVSYHRFSSLRFKPRNSFYLTTERIGKYYTCIHKKFTNNVHFAFFLYIFYLRSVDGSISLHVVLEIFVVPIHMRELRSEALLSSERGCNHPLVSTMGRTEKNARELAKLFLSFSSLLFSLGSHRHLSREEKEGGAKKLGPQKGSAGIEYRGRTRVLQKQ